MLFISLLLCAISMVGSYLVKTDFGNVTVKDFSILNANGHKIAATMYKPKTADSKHPAPAVVSLHGSYNSRISQGFSALELAKRGYVAVTIDNDGHGDSDNYKSNPMDAFFTVTAHPGSAFNNLKTAPTSGIADMVEYMCNNLDFIDKKQIGVTGHSLGGKISDAAYAFFKIQNHLKKSNDKISAVFLVGNQQLSVPNKKGKPIWQPYITYDPDNKPKSGDEVPLYYNVDYGVNASQFDENNYTTEAGGPWTFYKSNNARTFINELDNEHLTKKDDVKVGHLYKGTVHGSKEKYIRILYQPKEIHMVNPYALAANRNVVDFFQKAFKAPHYIDPQNTTMQYQQLFSFIGVIGFFMAIYSFACILLTTNFFGTLLVKSDSDIFRPDYPETVSGKIWYWGLMIIGSIIPVLWLMPLSMWIGGHKGPTFSQRSLFGTVIWPQGLQLEQAIWVASAGIATIVFFALRYYLSMKKEGANPAEWNMGISANNAWKTFCLAALAVLFGYAVVGVAAYFFDSYFSVLNWVISFPNKTDFLIALRYIPLFAIFYFTNAFTQNIGRMVKTRAEWKNTLLMCVINELGLLLLWIYQYYTFSQKGSVPLNSARVMQTWTFFIIQSLCVIFARRFYLKTGKIYLGCTISSLVFTIIACSHTMTLNVTNWWF
ncbi:alpha/beta fold hydrolase [Lactobacillus sp. ESL0791]|uniref:alpha/beta fold hydrolase n=1 Tax=Lactobacillus sp. ESL0791 TaxID=2983234 RepID=UPI0023F67B3B|nr:alpha/beta fold hydrolase [Lactobacillus sp. ESL0791]MDF7639857.1 alpha/beta fold hydrolase [Lactobacillus sp. ESL0791]